MTESLTTVERNALKWVLFLEWYDKWINQEREEAEPNASLHDWLTITQKVSQLRRT